MTMSHIAKIAGVSVATVSRTLNRPEKVRPELRRRILEPGYLLGSTYPNILWSANVEFVLQRRTIE